MIKLLAALVLTLSAAPVHADAFSDLVRMAGPSAGELARVQRPGGTPIGTPIGMPVVQTAPSAQQAMIRVTSTQWDSSFPLNRETIAAAGRAVGTKEWSRFFCEYTPGASTVRCDFAYDVWPEISLHGYDHVVADLDLKDPKAVKVVLEEWRSY